MNSLSQTPGDFFQIFARSQGGSNQESSIFFEILPLAEKVEELQGLVARELEVFQGQ